MVWCFHRWVTSWRWPGWTSAVSGKAKWTAGEACFHSPMWKYWIPKTQTKVNDLGVVLSVPFSTCWLPCRRHHRNRTCLLEALPQSASLEQTICAASDCLQLQTWVVPNPLFLVSIPKSVFFVCPSMCCYFQLSLCQGEVWVLWLVVTPSHSCLFFFSPPGKLALTVDKPKRIKKERQSHWKRKGVFKIRSGLKCNVFLLHSVCPPLPLFYPSEPDCALCSACAWDVSSPNRPWLRLQSLPCSFL